MKLEKKMPISLNDQVRHPRMAFPTPTARDHKDSGPNVNYEKAKKIRPETGETYLNEGAAFIFLEDYSSALASLDKAIALNGVAVQLNQQAFLWGRRAAHDMAAVEKLAAPKVVEAPHCSTLDEIVADRMQRLSLYQNGAYAERYRVLVERVRQADSDAGQALSKAVARYYFKLLAYKDEYEVARLYSEATFRKRLQEQFEGDYQLQFHLAPSWLSKPDAVTGEPRKRSFGPWMLKAFALLARFKFLRGTALDPFGYSTERRLERELIEEYEAEQAERGASGDKGD